MSSDLDHYPTPPGLRKDPVVINDRDHLERGRIHAGETKCFVRHCLLLGRLLRHRDLVPYAIFR